jgi:parallel beta-helix repeat protein
LLRYAIPGTRDLPLIVELTDPSVVQIMAQPAARGAALPAATGRGRPRPRLDSSQAVSYRAQLARTQVLMMDRLRALDGVQVQGSTTTVVNAVFARVPVEQYFAVRRLPGVKKVYFSRRYRMNLNAAATVQNAQSLWSLGAVGGRTNAGLGVKIGVIDSGIDISNAMFADSTAPTPTSYPTGFPKYDTATDKNYTNHKVIVARNYVTTLNGYSYQSVNDARDELGHGTFVAGCAAGKVYSAPLAQISGMAPAAFVGNYKVFGTPGINDYALTTGIAAAIEDAVTDGMDVLNLSFGSLDYVPPSESIEVTYVNNAIAAGLVVVMAAGNEGPDMHTIDSPASTPDAIAVGAVWNSRTFAPQLHVTGPGTVPAGLQNIAYQNGSGPAISTAIASSQLVDVSTLDGTGLACSSLSSGSLSGKIALIGRGTCSFAAKVTSAAGAGARAVIVYNNVSGAQPITMGGLSGTTTPAVMVSNPDGLALKTFVTANPAATLSIDASNTVVAAPTIPDILLDFSSRGPSTDFGIKPDLMAVGANVYSSTVPAACGTVLSCDSSSHFGVGDGTSFSAPMVSGAAAAVIQLFPDFTPAQIKSVLVNTASQNVTTDGTTPATVVQAGNGLLNMGNAATAGAVFSPTNLNFGVQSYSDSISLTQTFTITNVSGSADQYSLSLQPLVSGPTISLDTSNTGSVGPGSSVDVNVSIQATAPQTGGFQGFITVQSAQTSMTYSIPYWAGIYVPDSSRVLTVSQSAAGSNVFSSLKDALATANPGNIIEIADSQTYALPLPSDPTILPSIAISTNAQGLPLHGITIRAAAGQTPVLDGRSTTATADLQIVGLRNVLIQGLTINGGAQGIDILQPSTSLPTSVTIDHCSLTNQTAGTYSNGVSVYYGGGVDITYSTVSGSSGSGVLVAGGAHLTISNSKIQNNGLAGVEEYDSNVDLIASTFSGNDAPGAYLVNCSGTIEKSTFASNTGSLGDGIELYDGTMTITGNTFMSNDSAGIYTAGASTFSLGPTAKIERNIIQSNATYGIQSDQAQNLQINGNMIRDNGLGFVARGTTVALLINNIIVRSSASSLLDPAQRNGVYADQSSSVTLVNNTIYNNQACGIVLRPGATLSVWNTIVSQNPGGDLSGLSASSAKSSLIGGDPKFTNPNSGTDDFSLASGSPAIDGGSNDASNLPLLDYNQQLRVASAGALPGSGTVDIGAIEAGSSYPINYPLLVSGANETLGGTFTTGFAALNPSTSETQATFAAFDTSGALFSGLGSTNVRSLGAEAQIAVLDYQLFNYSQITTKHGGALASSLQKLVGFFLIFDPTFTHLADGVDVSSDTYTDFFLMRHESDSSGQATYQVFNPGVNAANVTATLMSSAGSQISSLTQTVQPKGQYMFAFNSVAASDGYVHVTSDRPVTGLEVFGNTTEVAALRAAPAGTDTRLFFPHFAVNEGYTSLIGVVNPSSSVATLTLTAYGNGGSVLGSPASRTVSANGQLLESVSSLFGLGSGGMITGYVIVDSDQAGIAGFSAFRYANGSVQSISAVPSESVPKQTLLFSHIAHEVASGTPDQYLTGIALLNPFGTSIHYTMKVFDSTGTERAELTDTLGPGAKVAKLLSWPTAGAGFFTQDLPLSGGHIEVTTDYQLLGFEMFFTQSLSQLAAVMAQFPT